jgi:outer membrane lipoprotein SlyB
MKFNRKNLKQLVFSCSILSLVLVQSCAETGRSTKIAAATGGALGASIGALIGNQTGNTTEGFLVGAVAGSGAGAAVGMALDEQDSLITQRNESIERQEKQIAVQQSELQELRRLSSDNIRYRGGNTASPDRMALNNQNADNSNTLSNQIRAEVENQDAARVVNQPNYQQRQYPNLEEISQNSNNRNNLQVGQNSYAGQVATSQIINANNSVTETFTRQELLREQRQAVLKNDISSGTHAPTNLNPNNSIIEQARSRGTELNNTGKLQISDLSNNQQVALAPSVSNSDSSANLAANGDLKGAYRWDQAKAKAVENAERLAKIEDKKTEETPKTIKSGVEIVKKETPPSAECTEAKKEYDSAVEAQEIADKLYHYRRALRLCPENPGFHTGLGKVYMTLNRNEDASYELNEALRIDPQFRPALEQLRILKK